MEALFIRILNMSLSAAVVIAAVLLARLALRRTPKKWSYLLWSVVGFRLCCPVSLKAAFSLFRLKAIAPGVTPVTVQAGTVSATAEPVNAVAYVPQNIAQMAQPRLDVGTEAISEAVSSVLPAALPFESVNPLQIWLLVGIVLWCAGMAAMLVYAAVRYIKMRRLLSDAVLLRYEVFERERLRMLEDAAQLRGKVLLYVCPILSSSFVYSFRTGND